MRILLLNPGNRQFFNPGNPGSDTFFEEKGDGQEKVPYFFLLTFRFHCDKKSLKEYLKEVQMKPKKLSKKLTLNKSTVANLEIRKAKGGICDQTNVQSSCHLHTASACPCQISEPEPCITLRCL